MASLWINERICFYFYKWIPGYIAANFIVMKKVNEIFYSLQGEGHYSGTPAVFVRFSGCNLDCSFCDTQHEQGERLTNEQILTRIASFEAKHVVLTGGEPTLQVDAELLKMLKIAGYYIQIETNGTDTCGFDAIDQYADWITCSPKEYCKRTRSHELKVVYTGQDLSVYDDYTSGCRYLQPCSMMNTDEVICYILAHPEWKLSLQTHKLINIR